MKVPKIRFKGFEGAWNIKNLWNNAKISTWTCVTDKETSDNYKYPVISGWKDIMWYYFEYNRKPNTITVARAWTAWFVQLIKTPFYLNDKCFSVISNSEIFNTNFLFFSLKNSEKNIMNLRSSTSVPTINTQHLNSLNISLPSLPEQEKIWSLFEQLDSQITKNQQKLEKLKNIKQSFLQKLFPKAWATVPELRFKGFEGAWEERKLGEIFEERHEVSTITEDYPQLSFSIAEWVIKPEDRKTNKRDFLIIDKTNKKYLKTELDDIIYNPSNIVFWAIHRNWLCKWVVSPIYKIFSTQQDSIFMDSLVTRKIFINETKKFLEWTVTKLRSLKPEAFLNIKVLISSEIKEQRRIWQLFNVIDKQIKLYEPQIQKLQNLKQSLLEKMFI